MLDIFNSDAFGVIPLSQTIEQIPYAPGRIGEMGLFTETSIATTMAALEERAGIIALVAPSPRGGPGETMDKVKRVMRAVSVPRFQVDGAIMAEEVQGVRAFGSETAVEIVISKLEEHMANGRVNLEITHEHSRLGAVKGVITYKDNSTLDLFAEFGVSQIGEIDFDLDNANPKDGALRLACQTVIRTLSTELGGIPFQGIRALCGDDFFDALLAHSEVRATYKNWPQAQILREGYIEPNGKSYGAFEFGGIVWENYRGSSATNVVTAKVHLFPEGIPGLFRTIYAPGDYNETVNTLGRPLYAKMWAMENDKGYNFELQSNALQICTRPRALLKGKMT